MRTRSIINSMLSYYCLLLRMYTRSIDINHSVEIKSRQCWKLVQVTPCWATETCQCWHSVGLKTVFPN